MQHCINRTQADESSETRRFDNKSFNDLLQGKTEHHGFKLHIIINAAVSGYEFAFADILDFCHADEDPDLFINTAFKLLLQNLENHFFKFFTQSLGGHPHFVFEHQFMIHTYLRNISSFF